MRPDALGAGLLPSPAPGDRRRARDAGPWRRRASRRAAPAGRPRRRGRFPGCRRPPSRRRASPDAIASSSVIDAASLTDVSAKTSDAPQNIGHVVPHAQELHAAVEAKLARPAARGRRAARRRRRAADRRPAAARATSANAWSSVAMVLHRMKARDGRDVASRRDRARAAVAGPRCPRLGRSAEDRRRSGITSIRPGREAVHLAAGSAR